MWKTRKTDRDFVAEVIAMQVGDVLRWKMEPGEYVYYRTEASRTARGAGLTVRTVEVAAEGGLMIYVVRCV